MTAWMRTASQARAREVHCFAGVCAELRVRVRAVLPQLRERWGLWRKVRGLLGEGSEREGRGDAVLLHVGMVLWAAGET